MNERLLSMRVPGTKLLSETFALKCISRNLTISAEKPKFRSLADFRDKTTNSVARLKIQQGAENCGL